MNIFRPSTCRLSKGCLLVVTVLLALHELPGAPAQKPGAPVRPLAPFLEEFKAPTIKILTHDVALPGPLGKVKGLLARPDVPEPLPAVLLIHDRTGLGQWMRKNVTDLAGIGYVVLALDLSRHAAAADRRTEGPRTLADLVAAVQWLRRRAYVVPGQLGVVGWSWGGEQAVELAALISLQGCVVCDAGVADELAVVSGLRATPLLGIYGGKKHQGAGWPNGLKAAKVPRQQVFYDGCAAGFMNPENKGAYAHAAAEDAWVQIYEFLGKHVEDSAPEASPALPTKNAVASIADIMRSVNDARGLRGALTRAMDNKPSTMKDWQRIHSYGALLAEAGGLLQALAPKKGSAADWRGRHGNTPRWRSA